MILRDRIYLDIEEERHRQERKWGDQHHGRFEWSCILGEEVGEVCAAANDGQIQKVRDELVQVAAVALAWLEDLGTEPESRFWDEQLRLWVRA